MNATRKPQPPNTQPPTLAAKCVTHRGNTNYELRITHYVSLLIASLLLSACLASGVTDVSSVKGRAVLFNNSDLYVVSRDSQAIDYYGFRPDLRYEPVIAPDGSAVFYVDLGRRLIRAPLDGSGPPTTVLTRVGAPGPGAMTLLPDGQLFLFDTTLNNDRYAHVINLSTGKSSIYLTGLNQIFFSASAIKPKYPPSTIDQFAAGRLEAGDLEEFHVVFLPGSCLIDDRRCFYTFTADPSGFNATGQAERVYDVDTQLLFSRRVDNDLTSGLLTPGGRYIILRVRSVVSPNLAQTLYLIDVTTNDPPVPLVENAFNHPDYAVSPDGTLIAFEQQIDNSTHVILYTIATGERIDLGPGHFDPQWWK